MITHVDVTPYGRPATEALANRVRAAKDASGALAPVTVIVGSNFVGLTARRHLGGAVSLASGATSGIANVSFITPYRLLEQLNPLTGRPRLSNPVLGASVRQALSVHRGMFAGARDHHATEAAVAKLYGELSHVSDSSLASIATHSLLASDAVALFREVSGRLDGVDNEDSLAAATVERVDLAVALAELGEVIWFLPDRLSPAIARLLATVLAHTPSSVVIGATGDAHADRAVLEACRRVGVPCDDGLAAENEPPTASSIVSVTDADEEVREVVRSIVQLARGGMSLDRIGVFYPVRSPYLRTLHQRLDSAGLPSNGPPAERLAESAAGRTLLAALALPDVRWRRDRVMALVADAPIRFGDRPVRPSTWERLSRDAGIVSGRWDRKLRRYAEFAQRHLEVPAGELSDARRRQLERTLAEVDELVEFMTSLVALVDDVVHASTWAAKSQAAIALLHGLIGDDHRWQRWPEAEQQSAQQVERALSRLGSLDPIDPDPDHRVFRRALLGELDSSRGRRHPFGHGVTFGPLASAAGYDLDAVFILGMAEGQCPSPRGDDALLPDEARRLAAEGELPLRSERLEDQHRAYLAALAAAPAGHRTLTFPRGDLRGGRQRLPARWLLQSASALMGEPVYSTQFSTFTSSSHPGITVVESHEHHLSFDRPESVQDWDVATIHLATHRRAEGASASFAVRREVAGHPAMAPVRRGLECLVGRASADFTQWDGNVAGGAVPSPARNDEVLSATRLETWAACGMRYLLGSVFGLADRDDPERIIELSALDRGSAVHEILERFVGEAIDDRTVPSPQESWNEQHRRRLVEIADEVLAELEQRGVTGRELLWRLRREHTISALVEFLHADNRHRSSSGATPVHVEFPFGMRGAEAVRIELSNGRSVRFRGMADRVDVTSDGRHIVLDYKTGGDRKYRQISTGDPVRGGETLQLGLYSEAVHQLDGAVSASAFYWMIDGGNEARPLGYDWVDQRRVRFLDVVEAMVDGIEAGVFPVVPGEWDSWRGTHRNCVYCPFDSVCPRDRGDHAAAMADAPELVIRRRLDFEAAEVTP